MCAKNEDERYQKCVQKMKMREQNLLKVDW